MAAEELQRRGHQVYFGYRHRVIREAAHAANLPVVHFSLLNDADFVSILKMIRMIRHNNLQLIISTKVKEYWLGTLAAKLGGCKSLIRLGINRPIVNKWKNRKIFGRWSDAILVNSKSIVDTLLDAPFIPPHKIHHIYNGVFFPKMLPEFDENPSPFIFSFVGSLIPRKNVDILIHSFKELSILHPEHDLRIWIIGDGSERENLVELTARLDIAQRVKFWGHRQDVPKLLSHCHAFVLVSDNEGFPNAALEAMSYGVPVVLSNIAGAKEIITDRQNGLLVEPNNEQVLSGMETLLTNSSLRRKLRENARDTLENLFTIDQMGNRLEKLLYGLCNG